MPLIYACIAPHAGDLIPEAGEAKEKVALTRASMQIMSQRLQGLAPETIIIINPHGFRAQNGISMAATERATAEWSPEARLEFDIDQELANAIEDKAAGDSLPVVRYIYGSSSGPDCYIPLDWGAVIPLYFLGHSYQPKPKIVHISPVRQLSYQTHYDFGRAMGQVVNKSGKRIAIIASADQGHAHDPNGPYGFNPASAKYDGWMQEVIDSSRLDDLLSVDPRLVEEGKPDSLWPTLILAGALKETPLKGSLLSYEVNGYFGILCAEFLR